MLLFISIVLSMLLVLRALNVFQTVKLKPAPQRANALRRTGDIQDINYERVE
jgi:hypothetical protein